MKRVAKTSRGPSIDERIAYKLKQGCRFHHISWCGSVMPVLAKSSAEACSIFNIWCGFRKDFDLGYSTGSCGVIEISDIIPNQFCMFAGRRGRKICIKHIKMS